MLNLLSFYARSRELIRNHNLIVVPRTLWEPMRGMISDLPYKQKEQREAELVEDLKDHRALQKDELRDWFSPPEMEEHRERIGRKYPNLPQSELVTAAATDWIVHEEYERIRHLRAICRSVLKS